MLACEKKTKRLPNGNRGTKTGITRHWKIGEPPCEECRTAYNEYRKLKQREKVAKSFHPWEEGDLLCRKPTRRNPKGIQGTVSGYKRHLAAKEDPCDLCREAQREDSLARYHENKEADRERKLAYQERYREENRDRIRAYNRNRYQLVKADQNRKTRERRLGLSVTNDGHTFEDITERWGTICYLCETEVDLSSEWGWSISPHVEHVIPVHLPESPGDVIENVRWSHARCNMKKSSKLVEELDLPFEPPEAEEYQKGSENGC